MTMIDRFKGEHRWLSNFAISPIPAFGRLIDTVEHAYQAAKADSEADRDSILDLNTPGAAKRLGQKIPMRPDWEEIKSLVMLTLLRRKYTRADMMEKLLATEDQVLIEGNSWGDTYWGCIQEKVSNVKMVHPDRRLSPHKGWIGLNTLGRLTMEVRRDVKLLKGI
jgi:ribA/ribD-fused uncharacterized protein